MRRPSTGREPCAEQGRPPPYQRGMFRVFGLEGEKAKAGRFHAQLLMAGEGSPATRGALAGKQQGAHFQFESNRFQAAVEQRSVGNNHASVIG